MTPSELLLQIANVLARLSGSKLRRLHQRREGTASLLDRVADILLVIVSKFEENISPIEECAELHMYAQELEATLRKTYGFLDRKGQAKYLADIIAAATDAPHSAFFAMKERENLIYPVTQRGTEHLERPTLEAEYSKLRQACGQFRAAAALLRAS